MELVALLTQGKGSWGQVTGVIKKGRWDKILIIGDETAKRFNVDKNFEFIQIDTGKEIKYLKEEIFKKVKGKIKGMEVALSIASGDGKEHMALISALLSLPVGVRFSVLTKEGLLNLN